MTNRKIQYWVVPPEADSEFVASMEDVLDTYANAKQRGVDWQFTVGDASHKLKSIYPKIKE